MPLTQRKSAQRISIPTFSIVAANFLITCTLWNTLGWFDLRGYREVINGIIYIPIAILALINLLFAALAGVTYRPASDAPTTGTPTRDDASATGWCFLYCALGVGSTILVGPRVGRFLNRHLLLPTPLYEASRYGDAPIVIAKIRRGADPNTSHPVLGTTLLHDMAADGETEAVKLLLQKGANPNLQRGFTNPTPLHLAIRQRVDVELIRALLRHGANPGIRDKNGETPISLARKTPGYDSEVIFAGYGDQSIGDVSEPIKPVMPP